MQTFEIHFSMFEMQFYRLNWVKILKLIFFIIIQLEWMDFVKSGERALQKSKCNLIDLTVWNSKRGFYKLKWVYFDRFDGYAKLNIKYLLNSYPNVFQQNSFWNTWMRDFGLWTWLIETLETYSRGYHTQKNWCEKYFFFFFPIFDLLNIFEYKFVLN